MTTFRTPQGLDLNLTTTQDGYSFLQTDQHLRWQKHAMPDFTVLTRVMPLQGDKVIVEAQLVNKENKVVGNAHQSGALAELGNIEQRAVGRLLDFQGLSLPHELRNSKPVQATTVTAPTTTQSTTAQPTTAPLDIGETVLKLGKYEKKLKDTKKEDAESYLAFVSKQTHLKADTAAKVKMIKEYFNL